MPFPDSFIWASATAAYQIEGGGTDHGRGLSTFDAIRAESGRIHDGSDANLSAGGYEFWKKDLDLIKNLGITHYRFSLSWSRILPNGRRNSINEEGIQYYRTVLEDLKAIGVKAIVTLFHCDWPLALFDNGGWRNDESQQWFLEFCELCFERFGDLVSHWLTFNEIPFHALSAVAKYENEIWHCPSRPPIPDPENAPYIASHNMILAHAKVYRLYKEKFAPKHSGKIGITSGGHICYGNNEELTKRATEYFIGWIFDPIFLNGNYPESMRNRLNGHGQMPKLPQFTKEEQTLVKGSADFLGINYYRPHFVAEGKGNTLKEAHLGLRFPPDDPWERICGTGSWNRHVPEALTDLLCFLKDRYSNPQVLITENGCMDLPTGDPIKDHHRQRVIKDHIKALENAMKMGCDVIGYTAWSLLDNFEWDDGFAIRFGLCRVDYDSPNKTRTPKDSYFFYRDLISAQRKTS